MPLVRRPGVRFANQALFHPLKYLAGLLAQIPGHGSHVFEHTAPDEFLTDPHGVRAHGHTVRCRRLVIATHVPLMGQAGLVSAALFQTKLASYSSYVVGARLPKGLLPAASFWDTAEPYHYLRVDTQSRSDYAIFGGADHKTGQVTDPEDRFRLVTESLLALLPQARPGRRWSGQVVETPDGLPYLGEAVAGQFVATGFGGNGMTFGTLGAMMARDWATGRKNPWSELFAVQRKPLPGGAWDYLRENLDYPYYLLKDRLTAAEGQSPRAVKRGEGKLLRLDGQRVAAYRDEQGKLTILSPVCTHLGCLVRWNGADATWDCACHGSRFKATGAVFAGPAEAPLEPVAPKGHG